MSSTTTSGRSRKMAARVPTAIVRVTTSKPACFRPAPEEPSSTTRTLRGRAWEAAALLDIRWLGLPGPGAPSHNP